MKIQTRKFKFTGITELLGSLPASSTLFTNYVAAKAPKDDLMKEERDFVSLDEAGTTVFARDPQERHLILLDYQIKGLFKEAVNNLKADNGVAMGRKKVDNYVFVAPRRIPIIRAEKTLLEEDQMFERPIRCDTMKGERVGLQSSEMIYGPWEVTVEITLLNDKGTRVSNPLKWETVEDALNYGFYKGLGQWRNGGYGRFRWEEIGG